MISEKAFDYCFEVEKIENYELAVNDITQIWFCHHRNEIQEDGSIMKAKQLKEKGLYFYRPASELIFLTPAEHCSLHMKGKTLSDGHKRKLSEAHKGKNISDETKDKISKSCKGKNKGKPSNRKGKQHSDESKKKISDAKKGKHWKYVDGKRVWY